MHTHNLGHRARHAAALNALRRLYAATDQGDALRDVLLMQLQKALDEGEFETALEVRLEPLMSC